MSTKELSKVNYNGTEYQIVDATADSKFSPVGHTHTLTELQNLAFDGTYSASTNPIATVSTVCSAFSSITASSLGLSRALKFIGFSTGTMSDGQTATPTISGLASYTPAIGDVVIDKDNYFEFVYTSANKWEKLGADDSYAISGTEISYTPAGTISDNGSTVNYTPSGTINTQLFYGSSSSIQVTGTPEGSVTITTTTGGSHNYTPAGSVTATFYGVTGTGSVNGSTSGVAVGTHTFTPSGAISVGTITSGTPKNYTPQGSVTITGQPASISVTGIPEGTVTITSTTSGTKNYTPTGTIKSTFTGTAGTISADGSTSGVAVNSHSYTPGGSITTTTSGTTNYTPSGTISLAGSVMGIPEGTVTITSASTGTKNYTPTGTIGSTFSGSTATIEVVGSTDGVEVNAHTYTPSGSITATTSTSTNYAPAGTVSVSLSGAIVPEGSVAVTTSTTGDSNYTPTGTVGSTFFGTAGTVNVNGSTSGVAVGAHTYAPTGTISTVVTPSTKTVSVVSAQGSLPSLTSSVNNEVLTWSWDEGDLVTVTTQTIVYAISSATSTFYGDTSTIAHAVSQGSVSANGSFTPSGTISSVFYGNGIRIAAAFTGTRTPFTFTNGDFTTSFSGTGVKLAFSGSTATLSHTVLQGSVAASGSYKPSGTVTSTFYGAGTRLAGTFTGSNTAFTFTNGDLTTKTFYGTPVAITFSGTASTLAHTVEQGSVSVNGTFTPSGAITSTFYGNGTNLVATFTGTNSPATGDWPSLAATFTGSDTRLVFTGTQTTLAHNVEQGSVSGTAEFTPEGTIATTFSGDGITILGSFSGNAFMSSGEVTPTGTIQQAVFTGSGAKLVFLGTSTMISI